jgi:hypothetical protein
MPAAITAPRLGHALVVTAEHDEAMIWQALQITWTKQPHKTSTWDGAKKIVCTLRRASFKKLQTYL